jgi:hypothetical protein
MTSDPYFTIPTKINSKLMRNLNVRAKTIKLCRGVVFLFAVLGLELRAYTLSYSTSPFFMRVFFFFLR